MQERGASPYDQARLSRTLTRLADGFGREESPYQPGTAILCRIHPMRTVAADCPLSSIRLIGSPASASCGIQRLRRNG
ncbi:hypothetical protein C7Y44_23505 [Paenibacillus popilliae]|uniref:Uncharacterized protein n=1 Tax=Paenibacillus popilliae TaxID=78057 RepID=A0ABY3AIS3_PAEPP|nr:hypothetical protein C7Y44_23505 [Paenibacillus sp. SDF0028]